MSNSVKGLPLSEGGGGGELAPEPILGEKAASEQRGSLAQMGKDMGCKTAWLVPRTSAVKGCSADVCAVVTWISACTGSSSLGKCHGRALECEAQVQLVLQFCTGRAACWQGQQSATCV